MDLDAVPLAPPLSEYATREAALGLALAGGEDYELLFTLRPAGPGPRVLARRLGVRVTEIGRVVGRRADAPASSPRGWRHFREEGDAEVGVEAHGQLEHIDRVAGLLGDDFEHQLFDIDAGCGGWGRRGDTTASPGMACRAAICLSPYRRQYAGN